LCNIVIIILLFCAELAAEAGRGLAPEPLKEYCRTGAEKKIRAVPGRRIYGVQVDSNKIRCCLTRALASHTQTQIQVTDSEVYLCYTYILYIIFICLLSERPLYGGKAAYTRCTTAAVVCIIGTDTRAYLNYREKRSGD